MQLLVHVFINLLRSCGYCESALSMGTHMYPPLPPPQGFIHVHVSAEKFKVTSTCEK